MISPAVVTASIAVVTTAVLWWRRKRGRTEADAPPFHPSQLASTWVPMPFSRQGRWIYSHGGWAGAAPEMLRPTNAFWGRALDVLCPLAKKRLDAIFSTAAVHGRVSGNIIRALENNPVVAAFGTASILTENGEMRGVPGTPAHNPIVLEWDLYLDTATCRAVDDALKEVGVGGDVNALPPSLRASLSHRLVERAVIAHGSLIHIILERLLGVPQHSSMLQRAGSLNIRSWTHIYFTALFSAGQRTGSPLLQSVFSSTSREGGGEGIPSSQPPQALLSVFLDVKSTGASPSALRLLVEGLNTHGIHVWGVGSFVYPQLRELGGVNQEIRVKTSPREWVLDSYVERLLQQGAGAAGGGAGGGVDGATLPSSASSSHHHEHDPTHTHLIQSEAPSPIVDVSNQEEDAEEAEIATGGSGAQALPPLVTISTPPAAPIYLLTSIGDLQTRCDAGVIPPGAHVLFNGGTLISSRPVKGDPDATQASYEVSPLLLAGLSDYVTKYDLQLGFYVQEPDLDAVACQLLWKIVHETAPEVFKLGFAYSGLYGRLPADIRPYGSTATTGFKVPWWLAPFLVKSWDHSRSNL